MPNGKIEIEYKRVNNGVNFKINVPPKTKAIFKYADCEYALSEGENFFENL
mgnify:CR=1 FL=1